MEEAVAARRAGTGPRHRRRTLTILLAVCAVVTGLAAAPAAAKPAPDTVIDTGPTGSTTATAASFTFHSTVQGATFTCKLDQNAPAACTSPASYSVTAGAHTITVTATANGITDSSPATRSWTVDVTSPNAPTALKATATSGTSVGLQWTTGTDNVGVTANKIMRGTTTIATVGAVTSYTDSTVTAGNTYSYTVIAVDGAGNQSPPSGAASVTTPTPPPAPDTVIDSAPTGSTSSTSASITFHSTVAGATFSCALDNGRAGTCTSPAAYTRLANGVHKFTVTATANGQTDPTPATASWTVDAQAPTAPTGLQATSSGNSVTLTWTASTDNVAVTGYDILRGGTVLGSVGAVTTFTDNTTNTGTTYTYAVRAKDAAGNTSAVSATASATPTADFDPHLTRAPYLTDLVGLHVAVNFATDRSFTSASAQYGTVGTGGACTPSTTVAATRRNLLVGSVYEYQWKVSLDLPATGTYCYRVSADGTDLLAGNTSPTFTTQAQPGSTAPFSFDVLGDWGSVDANGRNQDQANLLQQVAASGARFAVSVGDNGYPNGSQINYGDLQQTGGGTSAIFGKNFWTIPGMSVPLFAAVGNHGLAGIAHTDINTWTQDVTVASSNGRYQNDTYCCVNGSTSSNYGSEWYAFTAGNVRFYILDSAWGDTNSGTASPYANDALAHFAPGTPEYQWLLSDLQSHPTQLKFAFSHYPLHSDNNNETSDTFLQGAANLEGLLGQHGVQLVFNGHAHMYERNNASASGMPITYVTGGGGATLEPIGPCTSIDAYGIGWSPSRLVGSACGAARAPTSAAQVFHFLKVTVSGTTVTVTPTDETGRTFDSKSYTFKAPVDTYLDSAPPAGTSSTSATFTFHASGTPATYTCQLDARTATTCTSPITYTGLAQGTHTFSVAATVNKSKDPTPATANWTVDSTPPAPPTGVTATATSAYTVDVNWSPATDNTGVTAYLVYRNGTKVATVTGTTSWTDDSTRGNTTYSYTVVAQDVAGNVSPASAPASVTTAPSGSPIFSDGFESGDLSAWSASQGLTVEGTTTNSGGFAAEGNTTTGGVFAKHTLPSTYPDAYARLAFDVIAQPSQVDLLRLRDSGGASLGYAYIETTGQLGWHNDALGTNTLSQLAPSPGWHVLEVHRAADAPGTSAGTLEIWLDGAPVPDLTDASLDVGSAPVAAIQIGDVQTNQTYDIVFDDVAFGTSRLGQYTDTLAPSVPTGLAGTATGPFEAQLQWTAAVDDVGVTGYDVMRDGAVIGSVDGATTSYTDDTTTAAADHTYRVRATDASGNASSWSDPVTITQPSSQAPLFSDGFETGDLSAWGANSGLTITSANTHSGSFAVEGNSSGSPAFARATMPGTYTDAYARVAFDVVSQAGQLTLLRLRDTPTGAGGYVYLTTTGKLAFRSDALAAGTVSNQAPGTGWHSLELHLVINGGASQVQVWLDGVLVPSLSASAIDLGTSPLSVLQIGDTASVTADVVLDDAAFSTSRIGVGGDTTAPTQPGGFTASASDAFTVSLNWTASTDDVAVAGYDVLRDNTVLASVPASATSFTDTTVLAGTTYSYAVRARDAAGNVSAQAMAGASTPAAATPLFSDGFETGDTSGWTTAAGFAATSTDSHSGSFAAEGNVAGAPAFARESLGSTYPDAYARVAFKVGSLGGQWTLLRLRDTASGVGGYLFLTNTGKLAFRSDALPAATTSNQTPGPGWHTAELHLVINGASSQVQVWLDGVLVSSLSSGSIDLGSSPLGVLQIGDTGSVTGDVLFDDAAFSTSRIGLGGDTTAPSTPGSLTANATDAFTVALNWSASTDDTAVTGYDVLRDNTVLTTLPASATSYTDAGVLASTTYDYAVRARDAAGNVSPAAVATATTPAAAAPMFTDGFETGDLSGWTSTSGLVVEGSDVRSGSWAAEAAPTAAPAFAKRTLSSSTMNGYARVGFEVVSRSSQVILLRLRDPNGTSIGYVYLTTGGRLAMHLDAQTGTDPTSAVLTTGWHTVEFHLSIANGSTDVWLDGQAVASMSLPSVGLGLSPIAQLQIGDTASVTYDVRFDDAAFSTTRIGLGGDTSAPTPPDSFAAGATDAFDVGLTWVPSTDNVGVSGYDLFRDGMLLAALPASVASYTDSTVLAGTTYNYSLRARDAAGNVSSWSTASSTTPAAAAPLFADGFESGDTSAWTTTNGLAAQNTDARTGTWAAEGAHPSAAVGFVKKTLPATYTDVYARVAFKVLAQTSQITLLRLRTTASGTGAFLSLTTSGNLAFRSDALGSATTSSVKPGPGWHVVEVHLAVNTTNGPAGQAQVWLDGAQVPALTFSAIDLGTAAMGNLQLGDTASVTYDVRFDDAAVSTARIGLA